CEARQDRATTTTWLLSKSADRFTATVGIPDDGTAGASAAYSVLLDGAIVHEGVAAFGEATAVDLPVSGASQLAMRIEPITGERIDVAFGAAMLHGSEDGITRLVTR
ncbi:MAG: hypothetical protein GX862_02720, partial [Leucobacter sp.]|nr:hypothetical protein [Leucobacter sp.]